MYKSIEWKCQHITYTDDKQCERTGWLASVIYTLSKTLLANSSGNTNAWNSQVTERITLSFPLSYKIIVQLLVFRFLFF